ncbi:MAG TPA: pyrimidine reductase family protein [Streptosporangiaceae bacterium]
MRYSELSDAELAGLYAFPDGRVVRANMVASADGAATLAGASAGLSSAADRRVFMLNRALADVILVGANTARIEHYGPARASESWRHLREGRPATPPIAVVTARLDLDPASPLIAGAPPAARTIVITTSRAPEDVRAEVARHADVIVAGEVAVDPKAAIAALYDRGHQHILTEGGPGLLSQLVDAGLIGELCLTIAPLLAGPGAPRILAGAPMPEALPLSLVHTLEDAGFLLCRYKAQLSRTTSVLPLGPTLPQAPALLAVITSVRRGALLAVIKASGL